MIHFVDTKYTIENKFDKINEWKTAKMLFENNEICLAHEFERNGFVNMMGGG